MLGMKNHFDISGSIQIREVDIVGVACMSQLMRVWYLSHRRPAKAQASLRIRAV